MTLPVARSRAVPVTPTEGSGPRAEPAVDLYDAGLQSIMDADPGDGPWFLRYDDGALAPLEVERWYATEVDGDASLVQRCVGPTLDVGCGPGRLAAAVGRRALPVLGLDIAPLAVRIARRRGSLVVQRSVFDPLPGEGGWQHVLLADGNIGIGGDPARLLSRCAELMQPTGSLLVEVAAPGVPTRLRRVRIESAGGRHSCRFAWAEVSLDALDGVARAAALCVAEHWSDSGRWFAALTHQQALTHR